MPKLLKTAVLMTLLMSVLTGLAYPLVLTGVGQVAFHRQANGSLVEDGAGRVVGSSLIGQSFTGPEGQPLEQYFQPRPSATGTTPYNAMASGGSNLGPSNPTLLARVRRAVLAYQRLNGLSPTTKVPVDAVTSSASGLDPDISIANARLQAPRVARARHVSLQWVLGLIRDATQQRVLGIFGEPGVNVLTLNLALDERRP
jgi:K+-transporting ATPase ATPase C chain